MPSGGVCAAMAVWCYGTLQPCCAIACWMDVAYTTDRMSINQGGLPGSTMGNLNDTDGNTATPARPTSFRNDMHLNLVATQLGNDWQHSNHGQTSEAQWCVSNRLCRRQLVLAFKCTAAAWNGRSSSREMATTHQMRLAPSPTQGA